MVVVQFEFPQVYARRLTLDMGTTPKLIKVSETTYRCSLSEFMIELNTRLGLFLPPTSNGNALKSKTSPNTQKTGIPARM